MSFQDQYGMVVDHWCEQCEFREPVNTLYATDLASRGWSETHDRKRFVWQCEGCRQKEAAADAEEGVKP